MHNLGELKCEGFGTGRFFIVTFFFKENSYLLLPLSGLKTKNLKCW